MRTNMRNVLGKFIRQVKILDEKIDHIYANILTLMGIFVSVFSLITINLSNLGKKFSNIKYMTVMNLSLSIVICLFLGLIMIFINHKNYNKKMFVLYACIMAILIISLICVLFFL